MRSYGFTGPEQVDPCITKPLRKRLRELPMPDQVITGAAKGVDTIAARIAVKLWPKAEHTIVVPNFRHNNILIEEMESEYPWVEIVRLRTGNALTRNIEIVDRITHLIALPVRLTWYRSGTWHTINAARRSRLPVILYPIPMLLPI